MSSSNNRSDAKAGGDATPRANPHTFAAILSTGDEIVLGQIQDTNGRWFAERLVDLGITPVEHAAVADDLDVLVATIRRLAERVDLIVMSGGLGPTDGDLTRPALSRLLGVPLIDDAQARAWLEEWFTKRGRQLTDRQLRQAQRPEGGECLKNGYGTAPGMHVVLKGPKHDTEIYCLPGPPGELRPMFEQVVKPRLRPPAGRTVLTMLLQVIGVGEADAVVKLNGLTKRERMPLVGITASGAVLTIRIRYEGPLAREAALAEVGATEATVRGALGDMVFGADAQTLQGAVLDALKARGRTISVVESCTGGLLGEQLTMPPGSSAAFVGGAITYSNQLKMRLVGVKEATLVAHGAVSAETAIEMARGGLATMGADHCLAITGVAGPDGGSAAKPVGTVFIAHAWKESSDGITVDVRKFAITGGREDVRMRAARMALAMVHFHLAGRPLGDPPLLWQQKA